MMMYRRTRVRFLVAVALAAVATAAGAGSLPAQRMPERPKLKSEADTNDWAAYYRYGVQSLRAFPERAADAFYWAGRLNPAVAEPQYARGVALWRSRPELFAEYLEESPPAVKAGAWIDSLLYGALQRNPLVDQRLKLWMYDALPGDWSSDYWTKGQMAYGGGKFQEAVKYYTKVLKDGDRRMGAHYDRALAYVAMQQYDSALADLAQLVAKLRRNDRRRLVTAYDSKAIYEYAAGAIHAQRKDYERAREAFGRALAEDLSLYTAHGALGDMAKVQGDTALALQEYEQAVELGPRDANVRFVFATMLYQAGQRERAIEQFRKVVALEPYWAAPYMNLGFALEKADDAAGAARAYEEFLRRVPRTGYEGQVEYAQRRVPALRR